MPDEGRGPLGPGPRARGPRAAVTEKPAENRLRVLGTSVPGAVMAPKERVPFWRWTSAFDHDRRPSHHQPLEDREGQAGTRIHP